MNNILYDNLASDLDLCETINGEQSLWSAYRILKGISSPFLYVSLVSSSCLFQKSSLSNHNSFMAKAKSVDHLAPINGCAYHKSYFIKATSYNPVQQQITSSTRSKKLLLVRLKRAKIHQWHREDWNCHHGQLVKR